MTVYHRVSLTVGAAIATLWLLLGGFAVTLQPSDPFVPLPPVLAPLTAVPGGEGLVWLGTDLVGRDLLGRLMLASQAGVVLAGGTVALVYLIGLPVAFAVHSRAWPLSRPATAVTAIGRAVPVFVTYPVLIVAFGAGLVTFAAAFVLASLPGVARMFGQIKSTSDGADQGWPSPRDLAILAAIDALKRLALFVAIAEGINFLGVGPWAPTVATFGGVLFENRALVSSFPHLVFAPIGFLFVLLFGTGLLASGLAGLLPGRLTEPEPAQPCLQLLERPDPGIPEQPIRPEPPPV